ncbi:NAD-dependent succinate-semialdehyde dehydrogenase [Nocardioides montaniterrae]
MTTPPIDFAPAIAGVDTGLRIDGAPVTTERTLDVHDPATGRTIASVADGGTVEGRLAVDAAAAALPGWAAKTPRERGEVLRRTYELMVANTDRLAALMCAENGKSMTDARAEVAYAAEFFRWFGEEAVRSEGDYSIAPASGARTFVTHQPIGVAALVTPWNFPAAMATRKIGPALAAGCAVVLKPASETPLTALAVADLLKEAGVPDGVVNVVPTSDAGALVTAWLEDERVRMVSFTGSTGVGRKLLAQAAERVVNAGMELGGNAPFIVTADADLDEAVKGAMIAKFRNAGQACTSANRFYVHADVADDFVAKFGEAVEALKVGPAADGNDIGPMITEKAADEIRGKLADAVAAGARIAHQATAPEGWYVAPTVLVDVAPDAEILKSEIFGPVAPVVTWTDTDEMIRLVNDTEYGLAAYLYAGRLQDGLQLAERIEAGMVGINRGLVSDPSAPFGGVKQSGIGREGAREGIREFQETRYFSVDL